MLLTVAAAGGSIAAAFIFWLWLIDRGYKLGASKGVALSPNRWTKDEINETFERLSNHRLDWTPHLPPKQARRYIILGGSGLVGGTIILQLLARGQSPKSIRNIDYRGPIREDLLEGLATEVEWVQADISNKDSINTAFMKEWDDDVAHLPITVFHTASLINAYSRKKIFMHKLTPVNIQGTENVIEICKTLGVDILIYTSSGGVGVRPLLNHWLLPWKKHHDRLVQPLPEPGLESDVRDSDEYFSLYAATKALAERMVLLVNSSTLKTGAIRPCNGIYGNKYDLCFGDVLRTGEMPT